MRLLFVADPLEQFNIKKDSTFAMMKEAAARGHEILACEPRHLVWQRGGRVGATMRQVALSGDPVYWFTEQHVPQTPLADVDAVLMRKDPPFDSEYFYATHLLEQAEREAAKKLHYMKCPKCGLELHEISFKGVNIDKCFNCGAMVFDAGEFEMLAGQGDTNIFSSIVNVFRAKKVT